MKKLILASIFATTLLSAPAMAKNQYYDFGKVIHVQPVYKYVTVSHPQEECYRVKGNRHNRSAAPTIVGTIVGGVIGNAIGHNSSSRKVGTLAGAVIGGAIGHDMSNQSYASREVCNVSYEPMEKVRQLEGYKVKYRYKGGVFNTFTRQRPNDKIKLKINLTATH